MVIWIWKYTHILQLNTAHIFHHVIARQHQLSSQYLSSPQHSRDGGHSHLDIMPFCLIYLRALLGNFSILFIIRTDSNLHEPKYFFLCILSVTDLILTAMSKILSTFWFHDREIYFEACLVQVFLIHRPLIGTWQSAILWDIPLSWHTESSRAWGWLLSSVELCFSVLNPLCFGSFPTAELMSSLTPTMNLWLWPSWLVQRPGSAEYTA